MTVEEIARTLCEPPLHQPDFERALSLFSFQIELLFPRRLKVASYARLHAAVKFLEYITNDQDPNELALVKRSSHKGHEEYLRRVLESEGGIFGLGRSWSRRELTDQIGGQWYEARHAARMVHFSLRFAQYGDKRKGGIGMARNFVSKTRNVSDGKMKYRWREYRETAVFIYLMRKMGLRPARPTSKKFVSKLLKQAHDTEKLREFLPQPQRNRRNVLGDKSSSSREQLETAAFDQLMLLSRHCEAGSMLCKRDAMKAAKNPFVKILSTALRVRHRGDYR